MNPLMTNKDLIWTYQDTIIEIYKTENLDSLAGLDLTYNKKGIQFYQKFHEVTNEMKNYYDKDFNYFDLIDDIVFCSDELLFFTANLFLYKNELTDLNTSYYYFNNRKIYRAEFKIPDKRYNMFTDIAFQTAYNFWDRVGDLIASFFPNHFHPNRIYFSSCLSKISSEVKECTPTNGYTTLRKPSTRN